MSEEVLAARRDPGSGSEARLVRRDGRVALELRTADGHMPREVAPPDGYQFSHFADGPGLVLVCGGEAPHEGWWDWQYELDAATGKLSRAMPAY